MTYQDLTTDQKRLYDSAEQAEDSAAYLRADTTATAEDKAAVAEVFGGPGAGKEFLR